MSSDLKCMNCGQPSPPGSKFCPNCGTPLADKNPEPEADKVSEPSDGSYDDKSSSNTTDQPSSINKEEISSLSKVTDETDTKDPDSAESIAHDTEDVLDSHEIEDSVPDAVSIEEADQGHAVEMSSDDDNPNQKKPVSRILTVLITVVATTVILFILICILGYCSSTPLKCDESTTFNGVKFSYPEKWELEEKEGTDQDYVYIRPDADGLVMLSSNYSTAALTDYYVENYVKSLNLDASIRGDIDQYKIDQHSAAKAQIDFKIDGKSYEGYLLFVSMDCSITTCQCGIATNSPGFYLGTFAEIIDSARIDIATENYEVTFMSDGKEISKEEVAYKSGGIILDTPEIPNRDGYVLKGWELADGADGTLAKTTNETTYVYNMTSDITLAAQWEQIFTVTFTNGIGEVLKTETVTSGGSATAPADPKRDGYTFSGWSATFTNVTENLTVNAKWTKIPTVSESNALKMAQRYISTMAFSYSGLIDQLEYEGFSNSDATYGADNCGADWNAQAARMAKQYLNTMSFSRSGLIDQLEYEGFTTEQAIYGVDSVGL